MSLRKTNSGWTLLEVMVAIAIGVPILMTVYVLLTESMFVSADLGDSYQRRSQGYLVLERIASEVEMSTTESPNFSTDAGLTFNLPTTVGGTTTWGAPISYQLRGTSLLRTQGDDTLAVMTDCSPNGFDVTENGPILVMVLRCGQLRYAETEVTVSRTVVLPE